MSYGYVVLQPHSNTNPSPEYRVVHSSEWMRYVNGATKALAYAGSFKTYEEALALRDQLNKEI